MLHELLGTSNLCRPASIRLKSSHKYSEKHDSDDFGNSPFGLRLKETRRHLTIKKTVINVTVTHVTITHDIAAVIIATEKPAFASASVRIPPKKIDR